MLNRIIDWSLHHPLLVITLSLAVVAGGLYSLALLPIDAFPDTTPVQVQINTVAPALGPAEIERQVTFAVEAAISGLPGLVNVRSLSRFGLSQVTATFDDDTDLYFARQLVHERLSTVELPEGIAVPEMGPAATGLGEVFHYLMAGRGDSPPTLTELTTVHDWIIKPQLRAVDGVAEINTWGGRRKQIQVQIDPALLIKYALTLDDVVTALRNNNRGVGGGYIVSAGEASIVQGTALTTTLDQIAAVVITARDGVPIRVGDVGEIVEGFELRRGGVTAGGAGEVVLGLGFMRVGENSHAVTRRLKEKLEEIRPTLPPNVDVRVLYQRTELVDRVIETVTKNLFEGALLVVAVLFIFLGHLRAGLIVALAIPLAMLFSFSAMLRFGIAASLLSLGAIDFGLVVDSSVIVVENCVRHLGSDRQRRTAVLEVVREAAVEVRRPTMFGELIIIIVYLPILLLEGTEGKLFRPMALTVVFALLGSLIFSITLTPVLCSLFLTRAVQERENPIIRILHRAVGPAVQFALTRRVITVLLGVAAVAAGAFLATRLGSAFIPRLYEEAIIANTVRLAGVSLEESLRYGVNIEKALLAEFPDEIRDIWSRTGTAEVATDPMGFEVTDVFITLNPRTRWTRAKTQAELTQRIAEKLDNLPGMRSILTQPIEMRMNEMVAGVRADLGVKIFGDDLEKLRLFAAQVQSVLESIPGSADVVTEQMTGQPVVDLRVDQDALARYGIAADHVLEWVEAVSGIPAGEIREGQRRFELAVLLAERFRDAQRLGEILIQAPGGERLPLRRLARVVETEGPSTIQREWGKRRIVVQCNVRGRDLGGFVKEAQQRLREDVALPPGYFFGFGGQFEHLQRARARLMIIIPVALLLILLMLYLSTGTLRDSLMVLTGAPFAALGGVIALWLRGLDFTISAGVGFVAVSGVSMLSGLVLLSTIKQRIAQGLSIPDAIQQARLVRLRPIIMTGLVAALGFVPMMLNTGVGAEIQRPLATVVIGGVIADNVLTLLVLPALYCLFGAPPGRHDECPEFSGRLEPAASAAP